MSNEFDKEVADNIAAKIIEKEDDTVWVASKEGWNIVDDGGEVIKSSVPLHSETKEGDLMMVAYDLGNFEYKEESKEMSKIDFYRQKVQQYEAVENLMKSIECEIDDAGVARDELYSDCYSKDDVLYHSYTDMIDAYRKCYNILEEVLKDI